MPGVELAELALPEFGVPLERPAIGAEEYEERLGGLPIDPGRA